MSGAPSEWSSYVAARRAEGAAALELYVILARPGPQGQDAASARGEHLAYLARLEREGVLFAAGPLGSEDGKRRSGEGLIVVRASSLTGARSIAAADPMVACGAWTVDVRPWLLNEGSAAGTL